MARYLLILLAMLTVFCAPAHAMKIPVQCDSIRAGQAGLSPVLEAFLSDAPDALLRVCHGQTAPGTIIMELMGPRQHEDGICRFDAVSLPNAGLKGTAAGVLENLPARHRVYMRAASAAACPLQDDPSYTQTEAQYGLPYTDQFLWAMQALARLRDDPQAFAAELSAPRGTDPNVSVRAMLARNRLLPLRVVAVTPEEPSWRLLLRDARVTLRIEAPEDPDPLRRATSYTVTLEPSFDGFSVTGADVIE